MESLCNLVLEIYRAARETPVDEFQNLTLELVRAHTSFDSAHWGCGENTTKGILAHSLYLHHESPEILQEWGTRNRKNSVIVDTVFAHSGHTFVYHTPELFTDDALMRDYSQRYGHLNNMTIGTMSARQPAGQWLSLYRSGKHEHFSKQDGHMLEHLMPHLVEALEINRMLGLVSDSGMRGTRALVRKNGTICHCGRGFIEFMTGIWPDWNSGRLPDELMLVIDTNKESCFADHSISVVALGDLILLNIRKISTLHRLTTREMEVARLYGNGQSYKEIGVLLNISPATVRNFLGRIYAKLSVNNKVDLIVTLSTER